MTTRNGKIARLPKQVRHDLNGRLADGEPGKQLVKWLNGLPEVQEVLLEALRAASLAQLVGPGEPGCQLASMLNDLNLDLAPGTRTNRNHSPPILRSRPTESNPIKPNQTGSNPTARPGSRSVSFLNRERR